MVCVVVIGLACAAVTVGIPNVVAAAEEARTIAMLRGHVTKPQMRGWLIGINARWHEGHGFTSGEAYSAFKLEDRCTSACDTTMQVAFDDRYWICVITGNVITMTFGKRDQLRSWNVVAAVDAC